jgi:hypothetical protein
MEGIPSEGVTPKYITAMKLSTEAIVAAAVAVVFGVLSLGAIAREQGERVPSGPQAYVAASHTSLSHLTAGENDLFGVY